MRHAQFLLLGAAVAACGSPSNSGGGVGGSGGTSEEPDAAETGGQPGVEAGVGGGTIINPGMGGQAGDSGAPACLPNGADCTSLPNACCSSICSRGITNAGMHAFCAAPCAIGSECVSGCCSMFVDSNRMACAPRGFCPDTCAGPADPCTGNEDCCANYACVAETSGATVCHGVCVTGADCLSGCCVPLQNTPTHVCADPFYCQ